MNTLRGLLVAGLALGMLREDAQAYAFRVSPARLEFHGAARAGAVTIANDENVAISFQVRALLWSQDGDGEDVFADTDALKVAPSPITIAPGGEQSVQIETGAAPTPVEATYRLVIEELPSPESHSPETDVRLRFVVPVFVAPTQPAPTPVVETIAVSGGEVRLTLRNAGNRHLRPDSISLRRGETVIQEVAGWYVLAGAQRTFSVPIPAEDCARSGPAELVLKGDGVDLSREIFIAPGSCRSPARGGM
jgi:fimbrial chaperone protein